MSGRWTVRARGSVTRGRPWLVLRGRGREAVLWGGPVLELNKRAVRRLGPDILARPPDLDRMVANLRRAAGGREIGDALLDQRLVAGIGNMWKAESLWRAGSLPVAAGRPDVGRGATRGARGGVAADAALRRDAAARSGRSTARRGVHARGVGRRSPLAVRAMRTGRPTGARCASRGREERGDRARKWTGDPVAQPAPDAACVLPRGVRRREPRARRRRRRPVLVRGAPGAREPDALRVPAAGQALPRRARRAVRGAGGCPAGARRAGAGAGGGDLRAGSLQRPAELPRGADPHRAPAAPRRDGGGLRRLRLGRLGLRPCVRGIRGLALRLAARVRGDRAARGRFRRSGRRSRRRSPRAPCRVGRAGRALAAGRRAASRGVRARDRTGSASSSWRPSWATGRGRAACPTRRASSRTRSRRCDSRPPARSRPARSSSSGSTGGLTGFVRCCRSRRPRRRARASGSTRFAASGHGGLRERLSAADDDRDLGEALDRWELSLFQTDPFASEQLRGSLTSLLGGGEGLFAGVAACGCRSR